MTSPSADALAKAREAVQEIVLGRLVFPHEKHSNGCACEHLASEFARLIEETWDEAIGEAAGELERFSEETKKVERNDSGIVWMRVAAREFALRLRALRRGER